MEAEEENREPDIGEDTEANGEEDTQTEAEAWMERDKGVMWQPDPDTGEDTEAKACEDTEAEARTERDEMVVWPPETVIELRSVLFIF